MGSARLNRIKNFDGPHGVIRLVRFFLSALLCVNWVVVICTVTSKRLLSALLNLFEPVSGPFIWADHSISAVTNLEGIESTNPCTDRRCALLCTATNKK